MEAGDGSSAVDAKNGFHQEASSRRGRFGSACGRERRFEPMGELDVDFESRNVLAPVHPDNNLVGVERNMARYRGEDFLTQLRQQIGLLAEQPPLVRQQNLQAFAGYGGRRRRLGTREQ